MKTHRYWFGRKRLGVGIAPRSWEGWLVLALYAVLIALTAPLALPRAEHLALVLGLPVALLLVVALKYQR